MQVIKSEKLSSPWEPRFIIVDDNGNVLDDAQGWGYTSAEKAHRAWGWKTNKKARKKDKSCAKWWKKHKEFSEKVSDLYLCNSKELCSGEFDEGDVFKVASEIAKGMGIEDFDRYKFRRFKID